MSSSAVADLERYLNKHAAVTNVVPTPSRKAVYSEKKTSTVVKETQADVSSSLSTEYIQLKSILHKMTALKKKRLQLLEETLNFDDTIDEMYEMSEFPDEESRYTSLLFGETEQKDSMEEFQLPKPLEKSKSQWKNIFQEFSKLELSPEKSKNGRTPSKENNQLFSSEMYTTNLMNTPTKSKEENNVVDLSSSPRPSTPQFNPLFSP
jgi:hypothetical protein